MTIIVKVEFCKFDPGRILANFFLVGKCQRQTYVEETYQTLLNHKTVFNSRID